MKVWKEIAELGRALKGPSAVSIGNFDGVHVGHRAILDRLVSCGDSGPLKKVVMTFDPHPVAVLTGKTPPALLSLSDRIRLLHASGVDFILVQPFTRGFAEISAREFVRKFLLEKLRMKALFLGVTTHVGKAREGTPERVCALGREMGFSVDVVPEVRVDGEVVSSSRIRSALTQGEVTRAARFLGRPHRSHGWVVAGDGRGRTIGFPTANLSIRDGTVLPAPGVYATFAWVEGGWRESVTNIGYRPTFHVDSPLTIETHVLGLRGDLTGKEVSLLWIERIRGERTFPSARELTVRIGEDVSTARTLLGRATEEFGKPWLHILDE